MKKLLYIIFFSVGFLGSAQVNSENRFQQSEHNATTTQAAEGETAAAPGDNPGNPGDTTPIDDYIPLLAITAVGIIVYASYRKKALL